MAHSKFMLRRAFRAARRLAEDPDDLPQVFTVIESLSGSTIDRIARRFGASERGRRLIAARPDIVPTLADREALAKLPAGSLGRAYLAFVENENISAQGIRDAAATGMTMENNLPAPLDWIHARLRDTHDLWHAATGYQGDVLGEAALLGFILAQTKNPGVALIIAIALVKLRNTPAARTLILDGVRRGLRADWLSDQPWEELLALPVEDVRRRLKLDPPPVYTPVRTSQLRAGEMRAAA
jgi:ubiquinone biosynthesis protein COQ4